MRQLIALPAAVDMLGNSGENGDERVFVHHPCALGRCDARLDSRRSRARRTDPDNEDSRRH